MLFRSTASVNHVYQAAGSYNATLRMTDANGETTTSTATVTIAPGAPVTLTVTPASGTVTQVFTFTVTPTPNATPQNVRIDFGDGTAIDLGPIASATTVTKRYTAANQYTVRATQTNTNGTTSTAVAVVTVTS